MGYIIKTVCYFSSSHFENIGNAFIDIGSNISISKAINEFQDLILIETSMYPFIRSSYEISSIKKSLFKFFWRFYGHKLGSIFSEKKVNLLSAKNNFSLISQVSPDVLIVSGCVLTIPYFDLYGRLLESLQEKNVKIIFYGAGGNTYSNLEVECVTKWFNKLKPCALITRDSTAYELYSKLVEESFDGIDNAFFVNNLPLKNQKLDCSPYVILNFDKFKNRRLEHDMQASLRDDYNIVKTLHVPNPDAIIFPFPRKEKDITLISESPYDYLLLYANAEKVYSDRVHACIVSLSFGVPCRLFNDTPRIDIFSKFAKNINNSFVKADTNMLTECQDKQVMCLNKVLSNIV